MVKYEDYLCLVFCPIFIIKFAFEIGCFVCVCILVNLSSNNPFESHVIGNLTTYFYEGQINKIYFNYSKSNNIKNSYFKTKKSINNRSKDFFELKKYYSKKKTIRKLVANSFCSQIHDNFEKYKGKLLSNIFDLNYSKIHGLSIANMVVSCTLVGLLIITFIFASVKKYSYHTEEKVITCILGIIVLLSYIGRFILSIILFYYMEKGDIEKYDNFLECKNVKVKFFKKFSDAHKLRRVFFAFLVLNIVNQGLEKIEKCFDTFEKSSEEME